MSYLQDLLQKDPISSSLPLLNSPATLSLLISAHLVVSAVLPRWTRNFRKERLDWITYYSRPILVFLNSVSFAISAAGLILTSVLNGFGQESLKCIKLTDSLLHMSLRYTGIAYILVQLTVSLRPILLLLSGNSRRAIHFSIHNSFLIIHVYATLVYYPTTALLFLPQTECLVGCFREAYLILIHSTRDERSYGGLRKIVLLTKTVQSLVLIFNAINASSTCPSAALIVQFVFGCFLLLHNVPKLLSSITKHDKAKAP